ncbi:MAG: polysaccharide biosynthesis protein [Bacteroidales bacterium]|jgi:FlaA1/EpsC-like NDP-sugar epimerase|nr:polysaccharide biosynthesis protein [Bacteroidales bacterium]
MLRLIDSFMKDRYLPSWVIVLIDFVICVLSAFISGFILKGKEDYFNFPFDLYSIRFLIISIIFTTTLLIVFKVAKGVIRYSTFSDAMRMFFAVFFSSLSMLAIDLIYKYNFDLQSNDFIPKQLILIYFFVCYIGLFIFRMFIRWLFEKAYKAGVHVSLTSQVLIFGAGRTGTATANTLISASKKYYIKGFFDDDSSLAGKSIMGIKIYGPKNFEKRLSQGDIDQLIIATNRITPQRKNEIFDLCFANKIKVLSVPHIKTWTDGQLDISQIKEIEIEQLLNREEIKLNVSIIEREIKDKSVLVSGGAGSIGSELVRQIVGFSPKEIIVVDQAETPLYNIENEIREKYPACNLKVYICSIQDRERLKSIFEKQSCDIVFHAAAYKHVPMMEENPYEAVRVNVFGTKNIADLSVEFSVKKFVMISTDKAVNPSNVMGATKRLAEIYIQSLNSLKKTQFITTRFGNVLGSNGSVIPRFKQQIKKGGPLTVTHPDIIRYFMTIAEASRLVLEAGVMGRGGEIFLFDMGEPVRIVDLAKRMIMLSGFEPDRDIKIEFTGLRPGEKLYEELLTNKEEHIPTYHKKIFMANTETIDIEKVNKVLEELKQECKDFNEEAMVRTIKSIVPCFKSNNSRFSSLD